jgi:hypothetical protein
MEENKEEVKELVIGEFKPKRKFLSFVSALRGAKVRLIRNVAFIEGSKLSGMLSCKFKVTICDEGTINFEEVDTNESNKEMIKRLIDDLDSRDVSGYAQKFIISGLEFKDENGDRCYLEVEHEKPVEKFRSILDDISEESEKIESASQSLSGKGLGILDSLFDNTSDNDTELTEDDEAIVESNETDEDSVVEKSTSESYIEESFRKMNEEKINELKRRIDDTHSDIKRYENEYKVADNKLKELKESLGVLNSRLEQMYSGDEPNGYVFFVSEEQKNEIGLEERDKELVSKISDLMGLKKEALFNHLTEGFYNISIAKSDDITNQDFELEKEIFDKIKSIDVSGKITIKEGKFEYRGELNWHQLVQKMTRAGFEQDPEFDKVCNSNSYESKWGESDNSEEPENTELENLEDKNEDTES